MAGSTFQDPFDCELFPEGVMFVPSDAQLLDHLKRKVKPEKGHSPHLHIEKFIMTLENLYLLHPDKLPGLASDGNPKHFFHPPTHTHKLGDKSSKNSARWQKTGLTRDVFDNAKKVGSKRIFVLYNINHKKRNGPAAPASPEPKTKWVMHQYDLASEGPHNFLVSKIFWQKQPKVMGKIKGAHSAVDGSLAEMEPSREQSEAETLSGQKRALPDSCPSGRATVVAAGVEPKVSDAASAQQAQVGEGEEEVSSQPEATLMTQTFSSRLMCSESSLEEEEATNRSGREGGGGEGEEDEVMNLDLKLDLKLGAELSPPSMVPQDGIFDHLDLMSPVSLSQMASQVASQAAWDGEVGTHALIGEEFEELFLNLNEPQTSPTLPPAPHQDRSRIKTMIGQRLSLAGCTEAKGGGGGGLEVVDGRDGRDGRDGEDGDTAQPCLTPIPLLREDGEGMSTQEVFENLTPLEHDVVLSVEKEGKAKVVKRVKLTSYFPIVNKK